MFPTQNVPDTKCTRHKMYLHKMYLHKMYLHKMYPHKMYTTQNISGHKIYPVTKYIHSQNVSKLKYRFGLSGKNVEKTLIYYKV